MATDRASELQEQCGWTISELSAAREKISELQTRLAGGGADVTSDPQALAALHQSLKASVKASIPTLSPHVPPFQLKQPGCYDCICSS